MAYINCICNITIYFNLISLFCFNNCGIFLLFSLSTISSTIDISTRTTITSTSTTITISTTVSSFTTITSSTSATTDTSLLKPGASVRSLLDSFPELGLYCKVDGRFPFTVSGDVYAGPAVLMVNEGFFLITTELSEDGTDVLLKELTKQDTLSYEDLRGLYGS